MATGVVYFDDSGKVVATEGLQTSWPWEVSVILA